MASRRAAGARGTLVRSLARLVGMAAVRRAWLAPSDARDRRSQHPLVCPGLLLLTFRALSARVFCLNINLSRSDRFGTIAGLSLAQWP